MIRNTSTLPVNRPNTAIIPTTKHKIKIPSWCYEVEKYHLYNEISIYGYPHERLYSNSPTCHKAEFRKNIEKIKHNKLRTILNHFTGTRKSRYCLENNNKHSVKIVKNYEQNIFMCCISCCRNIPNLNIGSTMMVVGGLDATA